MKPELGRALRNIVIIALVIWLIVIISDRVRPHPAPTVKTVMPATDSADPSLRFHANTPTAGPSGIERGCAQIWISTYDKRASDLTLHEQDQIAMCQTIGFYKRPQ